MERGARLDVQDSECSLNPLALAIILKNEWAAMELLAAGADPWGLMPGILRSPMYIAAEKGVTSIFRQVAERDRGAHGGLDPRFNSLASVSIDTQEKGHHLINVAVANNHIHLVSLLIELGVDVNLLNQFGDTPLLTALISGREDIAMLLLSAGARVDLPSPHALRYPMYGSTPCPCPSLYILT